MAEDDLSPSDGPRIDKLRLPATCDPPTESNPAQELVWVVSLVSSISHPTPYHVSDDATTPGFRHSLPLPYGRFVPAYPDS